MGKTRRRRCGRDEWREEEEYGLDHGFVRLGALAGAIKAGCRGASVCPCETEIPKVCELGNTKG